MNIFKVNWFRFLKYNFFTKRITREKKKFVVPYWGSKIIADKGSTLILNGNLHLGLDNIQSKRRNTIIELKTNSKFICGGYLNVCKGTLIFVEKDAILEIGGGGINTDSFIKTKQHISIGSGVQISRDVIIRDDDGHLILKNGYVESKPIVIGDNVWLCERSCVLKGSTIGNSVVVGYGAIITSNIPDKKVAVNKLNLVTIEIDGWRK